MIKLSERVCHLLSIIIGDICESNDHLSSIEKIPFSIIKDNKKVCDVIIDNIETCIFRFVSEKYTYRLIQDKSEVNSWYIITTDPDDRYNLERLIINICKPTIIVKKE